MSNVCSCISFKEQLEYLRVSSKGAVVDGNIALDDPVKTYLHVTRKVERELETLLEAVSNNSSPQLVLLIGNVGDGKSHLLANLKRVKPDLMARFQIHNDATASFNKSQTYLDVLDNLLVPFRDENTETTPQKIILAINLGTLANFLEDRGDKYKELKEFITKKGIFSESIQDNGKYASNSLFQFINLTDYHLFSLTSDGPSSHIIRELLDRITARNTTNPFYNAYLNYYKSNEWTSKCPIKFNYEFIMQERVKEQLSKIIAEAIIRGKMVVSIRALLNFFYDALVPVALASLSNSEYEKYVKGITPESYLSMILPNYIFENPDVSDIFGALYKLDPIILCAEEEDILLLNSAITRNLDRFSLISNCVYAKSCLENSTYSGAVKSFPRLLFFESGQGFSNLFMEYSRQLYHFLKGDRNSIKKLFEDTINALRQWNGAVDKTSKHINLTTGYTQSQYRMSTEIALSLDTGKIKPVDGEILEKFTFFFPLYFKGLEIPLKIDFELYSLLKMISKGYIPNYLDKRNHINVQRFIDRAIAEHGNRKFLCIKETHPTAARKFELKVDDWNDFSFEEIQ